MPIKNYTTQISAMKSIGEIQGNLVAHGARSIMIDYSKNGEPESLCFIVPTKELEVPFRLPANINAIYKLLMSRYDSSYRSYDDEYQKQRSEKVHSQALKVGWRIIKDWIDAQMAIIETDMVSLEEVFLPYMQIKDGQTLYEMMISRGFMLPEGRG